MVDERTTKPISAGVGVFTIKRDSFGRIELLKYDDFVCSVDNIRDLQHAADRFVVTAAMTYGEGEK